MTKLLGKKIIVQRGGKRISTFEELKAVFPDLDEVLIDATEQRINRPEKKRTRKKHYSGKKKDFNINVYSRRLVILEGKDDGIYKFFASSDKAILLNGEGGGGIGDPFGGGSGSIKFSDNVLDIQFFGGAVRFYFQHLSCG